MKKRRTAADNVDAVGQAESQSDLALAAYNSLLLSDISAEFAVVARNCVETVAALRAGDATHSKLSRGQFWMALIAIVNREFDGSTEFGQAHTPHSASCVLLRTVALSETDLTELELNEAYLVENASSMVECIKPALLKAPFAHEAVLASINDLVRLAAQLDKTVMPATPRSLRLVEMHRMLLPFNGYRGLVGDSRYWNEADLIGQLARQLELVHVLPVLGEALKSSPAKRAELNCIRMDEPNAVLDFINWLIAFERELGEQSPEPIAALHGSCTHCGKTGHDASACYRRRFGDAFIDAYRKEFNAFVSNGGVVPVFQARDPKSQAHLQDRPTRAQRQRRSRRRTGRLST
jgi:hypothetical protein